METHYFWPALDAALREVFRVLKPGGTLLVVAELYKGGKHDPVFKKLETVPGFVTLSAVEHRELFSRTGYVDVQVCDDYGRGWICALGTKPR